MGTFGSSSKIFKVKVSQNNHCSLFSDGPTTQYRQKKNFYLFSKKIYEYGFEKSTWSFFEASHGKGAADGIDGAIKRTLDQKVAHGVDIPSAKIAFEVLSASDTNVKLFYIPPDTIQLLDTEIVKHLVPCPNTMQIHQLIANQNYIIKYREVSCFCSDKSGMCDCDNPKLHKLVKKSDESTTTNKKQGNTSITLKKTRTREYDSDTSFESNITYAETDDSDAWPVDSEEEQYVDVSFLNRRTRENEDNEMEIEMLEDINDNACLEKDIVADDEAHNVEDTEMEIEMLYNKDDRFFERKIVAKKAEAQDEIKTGYDIESQFSKPKISILSEEIVEMVLDTKTGLFRLNTPKICQNSLENHAEVGNYVLAKFETRKGKNTYRYVCLIEEVDNFSEKIVVKGLKSVKGDKRKFKVVEKDISIICKTDILKYLDNPFVDSDGFIIFPNDIDVKEVGYKS